MTHILYVAPFCHIPPVHGASQRGINVLLALAQGHSVTLLTYRKPDAPALEQWAIDHTINLRWLPDPPKRADDRLIQRVLARRPPGFASHSREAIAGAIDRVWAESGPFQTIYFATQILGQALLVKRWPAKLMLDMYDVYTELLRAKMRQIPFWRPYHWLFRLEAARVRRYEMNILKRFDTVVVTSVDDAVALTRNIYCGTVQVIPNGVHLPPVLQHPSDAPIILMVGNYGYAPNAEGAIWFCNEVLPFIRKMEPHAEVLIVGEGGAQVRDRTSSDTHIRWIGKAPELQSYYERAACVIIPVLSGGGTRLKLLEAMAWGVPVVSTRLGAQGVEHSGSIAIADTPKQFAEAVLQRIRQPAAFTQQAQQAREIIAKQYTWNKIGELLRSTVENSN